MSKQSVRQQTDLYQPDAWLTVGVSVRVDGPRQQCKDKYNEESDENDTGNVGITRPRHWPQWQSGSIGLHQRSVLTLVRWDNILHSNNIQHHRLPVEKGLCYRLAAIELISQVDRPLTLWRMATGQCDARPTLTLPAAQHHCPLAGTELYWTTCPKLLLDSDLAASWTHNRLIKSKMPLLLCHQASLAATLDGQQRPAKLWQNINSHT